jgi:hypothetical protein
LEKEGITSLIVDKYVEIVGLGEGEVRRQFGGRAWLELGKGMGFPTPNL